MTFQEFDVLQDEIFKEIKAIAQTKGVEYASDKTERLANFKRLSKELEISAPKIGYIYCKKHLDSINTYLKDEKTYSEETIRGRFIDAINYLTLVYALIVDTENEKQNKDKKQQDIVTITDVTNSPATFRYIYKGGSTINCVLCKQQIQYDDEYYHDSSGYAHYQPCPVRKTAHLQLTDIVEKGLISDNNSLRYCVFCRKYFELNAPYYKFHSGHYAHKQCYENNAKIQETKSTSENKRIDS